MGYHLKEHSVQRQNLTPPFQPVAPKTHTPLPPVQERGQRFYNEGTGRWISRDYLEENGGLNLYVLLENNSIDDFDILGDKSGRSPQRGTFPRPPRGKNPNKPTEPILRPGGPQTAPIIEPSPITERLSCFVDWISGDGINRMNDDANDAEHKKGIRRCNEITPRGDPP